MERAVTTNEQGENHSRALPVIYRLSLVHSFALQLWCLDYFCQSVVLHSFILSIPQCQSHFHQQLPEVPSVAKSRSNNRIIWQWYPDGNMVTALLSFFFFQYFGVSFTAWGVWLVCIYIVLFDVGVVERTSWVVVAPLCTEFSMFMYIYTGQTSCFLLEAQKSCSFWSFGTVLYSMGKPVLSNGMSWSKE